MTKSLIVILLCLVHLRCISLPLASNKERCMIVYSVGETDTVKVDCKLPEIPDMEQDEYYEISWRNTEDDTKETERAYPGNYKKEIDLSENIIYEVCFKLVSRRTLSGLKLQYSAENLFHIDQSQIRVPENLLKIKELGDTFEGATQLKHVIQTFQQMQKKRTQVEDQIFIDTNNATHSLMQMSGIQILLVIVTGVFQFFMLRKYLVNRQKL